MQFRPWLILCRPKFGGRPYIIRHSDDRIQRFITEPAAQEVANMLSDSCISSFIVILDRKAGGS